MYFVAGMSGKGHARSLARVVGDLYFAYRERFDAVTARAPARFAGREWHVAAGVPQGTLRVKPGQPEAGNGADVAMQVSSSGSEDLHSLVMFVVDAKRPFSSPATLH